MADSPRIEELRRRVHSDPASIAFAALAEEYRRAGNFEEAIATCITGLQRHPSYLSAHVTLGRSLLEVGRYEEAQEELEHVLKLAPENLAAIRGLAEIHHRRGDDTHDSHESYHAAIDDAHREAAGDVRLKPEATDDPASVGVKPNAAEAPADDFRLKPEATSTPGEDFRLNPDVAHAPAIDDAPALAGLEAFLAAIQRARAGRSAVR